MKYYIYSFFCQFPFFQLSHIICKFFFLLYTIFQLYTIQDKPLKIDNTMIYSYEHVYLFSLNNTLINFEYFISIYNNNEKGVQHDTMIKNKSTKSYNQIIMKTELAILRIKVIGNTKKLIYKIC